MPAKNGVLVLRKKSEIFIRGHLAISATNLKGTAVQVPGITCVCLWGHVCVSVASADGKDFLGCLGVYVGWDGNGKEPLG